MKVVLLFNFAICWVRVRPLGIHHLSYLAFYFAILARLHSFFKVPLGPHTFELMSDLAYLIKDLFFDRVDPLSKMLVFDLFDYLVDHFELIFGYYGMFSWYRALSHGITARFMEVVGLILIVFAGNVVPDVDNMAIALGWLRVRIFPDFSGVVIGDGFGLGVFPGVDIVCILVDSEGLSCHFGGILSKGQGGSFQRCPIMDGERFYSYLGGRYAMLRRRLLVDHQ